MWKFAPEQKNGTDDERKVRNINIWHFFLIAFIVIWVTGAYFCLSKKPDLSLTNSLLDSKPTNFENLFTFFPTNNSFIHRGQSLTNPLSASIFYTKHSYKPGDVVIVKYFHVQAVILEKVGQDSYCIIYKDHNHVLQKIVLPKIFLLFPSVGILPLFSLLID